jgi:hypothetical protein
MPHPSRPEVSDPDLRAALDRVGTHIESYNENLDLISNDIRAIEHYLTLSGVRLSAGVEISCSELSTTEGDYDVLGNYSGGICQDVQWIEWAPEDDQGVRWRLMYRLFRRFGQVAICELVAIAGPTFTGNVKLLERKPLIETRVRIRLQAHKYLAKLVEAVGKLVEYSPLAKVEPTNGDIPG